jgi:hypothetical protein
LLGGQRDERKQYLELENCGKLYSNGMHTFSKRILCGFAYFFDLDINLLQMQTHSSKSNSSTDITPHRITKYFLDIFSNNDYLENIIKFQYWGRFY